MKKIILSLFTFFVCIGAFGQTSYQFNWLYPSTPPSCNPFVTNNSYFDSQYNIEGVYTYWKVSHGSPYVIKDAYDLYKIVVLDAEYNTGVYSEGLFINSPFIECYIYDIQINLKLCYGYAGLSVYAANELQGRTETTCIKEVVPYIYDKDLLVSSNSISLAQTSLSRTDYLALKNYSYLWFYSTSDVFYTNSIGNLNIYNVVITKKGHETVSPTTPTSLTTSNPTSSGFKVNWTGSTDNVRVAGYQIYLNNSYYASTTSTNYTFSNLTTNQIYTVKVRAYDPVNNYSGFSNEIPIYITPDPSITGSTAILCNNASRTFSTTNYTNATYQWSAGSGLSLSGATSPTVTVTANAICKGNRTITLTRTMTLNGVLDIKTCSISFYVGVPLQPTDIVFTPETPCLNTWVIALVTANNPINSGVHYEWWGGSHTYVDQNLNGSEVQFATLTQFWYYTYVYVRATNICGSTPDYSEILTVNDCGGGIISPSPKKPLSFSKVSLYPNPTNGMVNIELPKSINENSLFEIKVFDILGKLLLTKSSISGNSKQSIDLSQYNSGNYIIIISNSEGLVEKQLINLSK